ncbi:O-antigen ligase family protein [Cellulomonas sp. S1-8]|uniref:O-antigen ligase family protein n=1 Tax=Cellulomonas sp. S1-8 TaxID=2904790 RepID=UPI002243EB78|nr:O-antigen ligase family protein [Cellulomonas sp. S1-8]UZN04297.1 O-antigen ligase family protein [Cellulomonas sp. S1-8]
MAGTGPGRETAAQVRTRVRVLLAACVVGAVVGGWLLAQGVAPVLVVAAAAGPLLLAVGHRYGFWFLAGAVVLRPLVDSGEVPGATGALGVGVLALGLVAALHDVRALILLALAAVPVGVATAVGYPAHGMIAIEEGLRLLSVVAVAAVVLADRARPTRTRAARVVQVAGIVPALVAVQQAVTGSGTTIGTTMRASGTLSQANPAAFFFTLCAIASLVLAFEGTRRRLDLAAVVGFSVAVVTTGSITGLMSLVLGLVLCTVLMRGLLSRATGVLLLSLGVLVLGALASPVGRGRLAEFTAAPSAEAEGNSLLWRYEAWGKIIDAWQTSPVTGLGLGATMPGGVLVTNIPHNEYLWLLAEMGVLGLGLLVLVVLATVGLVLRFVRQGAARENAALVVTLVAATALNASADNTLHFTPSLYALTLLLATAWRCASVERAVARALDPPVGPPPHLDLRRAP